RWFEAKGYINNGREYDLLREYTGDEGKTLPEMDNVEFTLLDQKEKEAFLAFLYRCFPGRWEYEALEYFRKGGTGREFVVLRKNNRIIGFCRINDEHSDRKSTRLNSSHVSISYAVFCLKKKK